MTSSLEREQIPRSADRLLWLEDLQVEGFCQQTFHGFDPGQGAFEGGVGAGLDGYYEGQIVPSEAGLLEDGVNVDALLRQREGDFGDDSGLIGDHEANGVAQQELASDGGFAAGQVDGARTVGDADDVGDDGYRRWMAACSVAG